MPKFFDPDEEYDKKHEAWLRSVAGRKSRADRDKRQAEWEADYKNPDKPPSENMVWSKKHSRWVWPDTRSAARKRRDAMIAREVERARRIWKPIEDRIPKGWGPHVSCGMGWKDLIFDLTRDIDRVWEGFAGRKGRDCWVPLQVKEKMGGLRYYIENIFRFASGDSAKIRDDAEWRSRLTHLLIGEAEEKSFGICETCSKHGHRRTVDGWFRVECDDHYKERLNFRYRERCKREKGLRIESLMDEEEIERLKRAKKLKRKKA